MDWIEKSTGGYSWWFLFWIYKLGWGWKACCGFCQLFIGRNVMLKHVRRSAVVANRSLPFRTGTMEEDVRRAAGAATCGGSNSKDAGCEKEELRLCVSAPPPRTTGAENIQTMRRDRQTVGSHRRAAAATTAGAANATPAVTYGIHLY